MMSTAQRFTLHSQAQKSGEPKMMTNARFRTFAIVATIARTSQAHGVLSRCRNPSKLHVSQAAEARGDDSSGEIRM